MKLIFLDIDGVLNHELWAKELIDTGRLQGEVSTAEYERSQFCPRSVDLLNTLTNSTGAQIVVSSSWRMGRTVEQLASLFESVGITGEVLGKTPHLYFQEVVDGEPNDSVPRGAEIHWWMQHHKDRLGKGIGQYTGYVILDDDSDMLYWQRNNYICVDSYCGLTPSIIYKAKQILNRAP